MQLNDIKHMIYFILFIIIIFFFVILSIDIISLRVDFLTYGDVEKCVNKIHITIGGSLQYIFPFKYINISKICGKEKMKFLHEPLFHYLFNQAF